MAKAKECVSGSEKYVLHLFLHSLNQSSNSSKSKTNSQSLTVHTNN